MAEQESDLAAKGKAADIAKPGPLTVIGRCTQDVLVAVDSIQTSAAAFVGDERVSKRMDAMNKVVERLQLTNSHLRTIEEASGGLNKEMRDAIAALKAKEERDAKSATTLAELKSSVDDLKTLKESIANLPTASSIAEAVKAAMQTSIGEAISAKIPSAGEFASAVSELIKVPTVGNITKIIKDQLELAVPAIPTEADITKIVKEQLEAVVPTIPTKEVITKIVKEQLTDKDFLTQVSNALVNHDNFIALRTTATTIDGKLSPQLTADITSILGLVTNPATPAILTAIQIAINGVDDKIPVLADFQGVEDLILAIHRMLTNDTEDGDTLSYIRTAVDNFPNCAALSNILTAVDGLPNNTAALNDIQNAINGLPKITTMRSQLPILGLTTATTNSITDLDYRGLGKAIMTILNMDHQDTLKRVSEVHTFLNTGGAVRTILDQGSQRLSTIAEHSKPLLQDLPPGMTAQQVPRFWDVSQSGIDTIWGVPSVVKDAGEALLTGLVRQEWVLNGTEYDNAFYALRAAFEPILKKYKIPDDRVDLLAIRMSKQYETKARSATHDPLFTLRASDDKRMTIECINVLCAMVSDVIYQATAPSRVTIFPTIFVRSVQFGGYRVLRTSLLQKVTDYLWLGNADGNEQQEGSTTFSRWDFGPKWSSVAPPGALVSDMTGFDQGRTIARDKMEAATRRVRLRHSPSELALMDPREAEVEIVHDAGLDTSPEQFRRVLSQIGMSRTGTSLSFRPSDVDSGGGVEIGAGETPIVPPEASDRQSQKSGTMSNFGAKLDQGFNTLKHKLSYDTGGHDSAIDPNAPPVPRLPMQHRAAPAATGGITMAAFPIPNPSGNMAPPAVRTTRGTTMGPPAIPTTAATAGSSTTATGVTATADPSTTATAGPSTAATTGPSTAGPAPEVPDNGYDPPVPVHFGLGTKRWVGPTFKAITAKDLANRRDFDEPLQNVLTKVIKPKLVKEPENLRRRCADKNKVVLTKCMASYGSTTGPKETGWKNLQGPCDECERLGRQCVVMIEVEWAYIKGRGSGTGI